MADERINETLFAKHKEQWVEEQVEWYNTQLPNLSIKDKMLVEAAMRVGWNGAMSNIRLHHPNLIEGLGQ